MRDVVRRGEPAAQEVSEPAGGADVRERGSAMRTNAVLELVVRVRLLVVGWVGAVVATRVRPLATSERGDVPGWVLVTVMTAGLVTAIWLVADGQLTSVLGNAIKSVTKP